MNTQPGQCHPYRHTREDDLQLLATGAETGRWDQDGRPGPWPEDFLDPNTGWTTTGTEQAPTHNPENPPLETSALTWQENPPHWPEN